MEQITELWRLFLRRFWLIAVVATVGIIISTFYAYIKPASYEAKAKIVVESPLISAELASSTVTATAEKRLKAIQQRLMSRTNMQNLIEELKLFQKRDDLTTADQIAQLRGATSIKLDDGRRRRRGDKDVTTFTISVILDSPFKTATIANRFATLVLEENAKARNDQATETLQHFTDLVEQGRVEVRALDQEIAAFRAANRGDLPDSLDYRQGRLTQLEGQKQTLEQSLVTYEDQRGALLLQLKAPAEEDTPEKARLRQLEAELAQKSAVLSDQHREIRALKAEIAALKRAIANSAQSAAEEYRQAEIKRQLEVIADNIALVEKQQQDLDTQRHELRDSLQRTVDVGAEMNSLLRKLEDAQARLNENNQKRRKAETGAALEANQKAETFEILEDAVVPSSPVSPNRKKIAIMGSGFSLALAFGLAFFWEMLRPRIRSAAQMERVMNLRPVITIPYVRTKRNRRFRMLKIASLVLIVGAGVPTALYQVDQNYMPLELIAEKVSDKTGFDQIIRWTEKRF